MSQKVIPFYQWLAGYIDGVGSLGYDKIGEPFICFNNQKDDWSMEIKKEIDQISHMYTNTINYKKDPLTFLNLINALNGQIRNNENINNLKLVCSYLKIDYIPANTLTKENAWIAGLFDAIGRIDLNFDKSCNHITIWFSNEYSSTLTELENIFIGKLQKRHGLKAIFKLRQKSSVQDFLLYAEKYPPKSEKLNLLNLLKRFHKLRAFKAYKAFPGTPLFNQWIDFKSDWSKEKQGHSFIKSENIYKPKFNKVNLNLKRYYTTQYNSFRHGSSDIYFNQWLAGFLDGTAEIKYDGTLNPYLSLKLNPWNIKAIPLIKKKLNFYNNLEIGSEQFNLEIKDSSLLLKIINSVNGELRTPTILQDFKPICESLKLQFKEASLLTKENTWTMGYFDAVGMLDWDFKKGVNNASISFYGKSEFFLASLAKTWEGKLRYMGTPKAQFKLIKIESVKNFLNYSEKHPSKTKKLNLFNLLNRFYTIMDKKISKDYSSFDRVNDWAKFQKDWNYEINGLKKERANPPLNKESPSLILTSQLFPHYLNLFYEKPINLEDPQFYEWLAGYIEAVGLFTVDIDNRVNLLITNHERDINILILILLKLQCPITLKSNKDEDYWNVRNYIWIKLIVEKINGSIWSNTTTFKLVCDALGLIYKKPSEHQTTPTWWRGYFDAKGYIFNTFEGADTDITIKINFQNAKPYIRTLKSFKHQKIIKQNNGFEWQINEREVIEKFLDYINPTELKSGKADLLNMCKEYYKQVDAKTNSHPAESDHFIAWTRTKETWLNFDKKIKLPKNKYELYYSVSL